MDNKEQIVEHVVNNTAVPTEDGKDNECIIDAYWCTYSISGN